MPICKTFEESLTHHPDGCPCPDVDWDNCPCIIPVRKKNKVMLKGQIDLNSIPKHERAGVVKSMIDYAKEQNRP